MITAIIISGDSSSTEHINALLSSFESSVNIIALAADIKSGIKEINDQSPDLVILDTYLKDGSGFELLKHFQNPDFRIIFISEYAEYAIKAFDYNCVGYVLKPINDQKFAASLSKAINQIRLEEKLQMKQLATDLEDLSKTEKLILRTNEEIHTVDFHDIIRVEAGGNYAEFFISDGRKVLVSKPMKEYEERLLDNSFFRIHKSHMVNIKRLKYFDKADGGYLVMSDNSKVPVASRKRDAVIELLESFG